MTPTDRPLPARCPVPECDRPLHDGLHEDSDGFRWRQDEEQRQREAAQDRDDLRAKGLA